MAKKKKTLRSAYDRWMEQHPALTCVVIGASTAAALVTLFAFVTFSGFGGSAEFIYSQF